MIRRQQRATNTRKGSGKDQDPLEDKFIKATNADLEESGLPSFEERQTFGHTPTTWMVVKISSDRMQAILECLTFGGDTTLTDQDVLKALREQYHITEGIDEVLVQELTTRALAQPTSEITGRHLIASGTPPVPGQDGRIEFAFEQRLAKRTRPAYGEIKTAFAADTLTSVVADDILGLQVTPGEELAQRIVATEGEAGCDIFGHTHLCPGEDPVLAIGPYVRESQNRFFAEILGYLCLIDDQLSIIPPFWISADKMEAFYVHFKQASTSITLRKEWIVDTLSAVGIRHGYNDDEISALSKKPLDPEKKKTLLIAQGTQPAPGVDTHIDYPFDYQKQAGKIMPDGSIDLRERNAVIGVKKDQSLGSVIPASDGVPGTNLYGEALPTTDGEEIVFKAGENVRSEGNPPQAFFSAIDGNVQISEETIHVKEVFVVSGNVDYETGNIDTPNDVQIEGNIRAGFTVKAGGSISVGGLVEAGATLSAHGDIIVAQGIVGEGTHVQAQGLISLGNVQTKFIQNATVLAKTDIEVGSYIFNSQVRSGGKIKVHAEGGERGGSIVGGETLASKAVHCRIIGSPSTSGTLIGISPDPEKSAQAEKLDKAINFCESNIVRLLRSMGLQTVDASRIKTILRQTPPTKQKVMLEIVRKLYELVETREKSITRRKDLEETLNRVLDQAEISIDDMLFAGVQISMGKSFLTTKQDDKGVTLFKTSDGIQIRPIAN